MCLKRGSSFCSGLFRSAILCNPNVRAATRPKHTQSAASLRLHRRQIETNILSTISSQRNSSDGGCWSYKNAHRTNISRRFSLVARAHKQSGSLNPVAKPMAQRGFMRWTCHQTAQGRRNPFLVNGQEARWRIYSVVNNGSSGAVDSAFVGREVLVIFISYWESDLLFGNQALQT
jgi:hypothetical protein